MRPTPASVTYAHHERVQRRVAPPGSRRVRRSWSALGAERRRRTKGSRRPSPSASRPARNRSPGPRGPSARRTGKRAHLLWTSLIIFTSWTMSQINEPNSGPADIWGFRHTTSHLRDSSLGGAIALARVLDRRRRGYRALARFSSDHCRPRDVARNSHSAPAGSPRQRCQSSGRGVLFLSGLAERALLSTSEPRAALRLERRRQPRQRDASECQRCGRGRLVPLRPRRARAPSKARCRLRLA